MFADKDREPILPMHHLFAKRVWAEPSAREG